MRIDTLIKRLGNVVDLLEEAVDDMMYIETNTSPRALEAQITAVVAAIESVGGYISELIP